MDGWNRKTVSSLMEIQLMMDHHDSWCSIQRTTKNIENCYASSMPNFTLKWNTCQKKGRNHSVLRNLISEISTYEILPVSWLFYTWLAAVLAIVHSREQWVEAELQLLGTPVGPKISFGGHSERDAVFLEFFIICGTTRIPLPLFYRGLFWSQG